MKFDDKDIEAVAKARVSRVEKKRSNYWFVGILIAIALGYTVAVPYSLTGIGVGICAVSIIAMLYYTNTLNKKQRAAADKLLKEWRGENK